MVMFTWAAETVVARDPASVGRLLVEPARWPEWTDMTDVKIHTEGPLRVGSRVSASMGSGPLKSRVTWEVTELDPERVLSFRMIASGRLGMDGTYRLEALPGGRTRVRVEGRVITRGFLRLLEPFLRGEVRAGEARELERMRAFVEAEGRTANGPVPVSA
jgi:uncharacterized protein YndB with AHSA1/START domain